MPKIDLTNKIVSWQIDYEIYLPHWHKMFSRWNHHIDKTIMYMCIDFIHSASDKFLLIHLKVFAGSPLIWINWNLLDLLLYLA